MAAATTIDRVLQELKALGASDEDGVRRLRAQLRAGEPLLPQLAALGVDEALAIDAASLALDVPVISIRAVRLGKTGREQVRWDKTRALVFGERAGRQRVAYADVEALQSRDDDHDAYLAGPRLASLVGGVRLSTTSAEPHQVDWDADVTEADAPRRPVGSIEPLHERAMDQAQPIPAYDSGRAERRAAELGLPSPGRVKLDDDEDEDWQTQEVRVPVGTANTEIDPDGDDPAPSEIDSWDPEP